MALGVSIWNVPRRLALLDVRNDRICWEGITCCPQPLEQHSMPIECYLTRECPQMWSMEICGKYTLLKGIRPYNTLRSFERNVMSRRTPARYISSIIIRKMLETTETTNVGTRLVCTSFNAACFLQRLAFVIRDLIMILAIR